MNSELVPLVDEALRLEQDMKRSKKRLDELKATLTSAGIFVMDNKNLSHYQIPGSKGRFNLTYKEKFEIDNYERLVEVLGDVVAAKVSRKYEVKFETEARFKEALIALYKGEYCFDTSIDDVLSGLGLDSNKVKAVKKKLKGDYLKDKQLLGSVGITGELEEELDAIRLAKHGELVERFFGHLTPEEIDTIRNSVYVEDSI
ncbi:ABC transporter permease, partial [Bacillus cereus]|nr:ABC transporter permease [Bacillus cereus]